MKNRAKCKLCESIIESNHERDYVSCRCGEISVDGGELMRCAARNFNNFIRVDDEGNEIVVQVTDFAKPTYAEMLKMLEEMIQNIERLPNNAMISPVTHYDLASALLLILSIFRTKNDS